MVRTNTYKWMKAIIAIIFCMGCFNIASGQGQVLSNLQSTFSTYQKSNLQEKEKMQNHENVIFLCILKRIKMRCPQ